MSCSKTLRVLIEELTDERATREQPFLSCHGSRRLARAGQIRRLNRGNQNAGLLTAAAMRLGNRSFTFGLSRPVSQLTLPTLRFPIRSVTLRPACSAAAKSHLPTVPPETDLNWLFDLTSCDTSRKITSIVLPEPTQRMRPCGLVISS